MKEVYVVESLRTPQGSFGGALSDVAAPRLAAAVMTELLERTGLAAEAVDEVIVGQVLSGGTGQAPARQAMRYAELPDTIPAMTINKVCGSGLKAALLGAGSIQLGDAEVVIAGGMGLPVQDRLEEAEINVVLTDTRVIDEAIEMYAFGTLVHDASRAHAPGGDHH